MPKIRELDGIRAIAVSIVFVAHYGFGRSVPGGLGVTIFFFLSGYLITSLLRAEWSQTGEVSLTGFYARRTLRIMPPLYITLVISGFLWAIGALRVSLSPGSVVAQIFFYSNYERLWGPHHAFPIPLWSLAVEEHFYLIFPLLFAIWLARLPPRIAAGALAAGCLVVLVCRCIQAAVMTNGLAMNYFLTHTRIDSILFGCCLAVWNNPAFGAAWRPSAVQFATATLVILGSAALQWPFFADTFRYTLQGAALFVAFSYVLHRPAWTSTVLNSRPLQIVGLYSYTLYLVHGEVKLVLHDNLGLTGWTLFIAGAGMSMLYAAGMHRFVEAPLASVRRRLHEEAAPAPLGL